MTEEEQHILKIRVPKSKHYLWEMCEKETTNEILKKQSQRNYAGKRYRSRSSICQLTTVH